MTWSAQTCPSCPHRGAHCVTQGSGEATITRVTCDRCPCTSLWHAIFGRPAPAEDERSDYAYDPNYVEMDERFL